MNWFDTSGITNLAKNALKEAQKTLDKALDIQDESEDEEQKPQEEVQPSASASTPQDSTDFFASWGLTVSAESSNEKTVDESSVVTESPSKAPASNLWGSFAGSFFDPTKSAGAAIVNPSKAKSLNVIADYENQEDLFSKSQLIISEDPDSKREFKPDPKVEERRSSSISAGLSLMSSINSSESVEVLSQSLKSTPDSEVASGNSSSHSTSADKKPNSESVEVFPESLISPSSIECLGFDSYSSDKTSTPSALSPEESDKKSTPVGEVTEKPETADSVSLVADDDEDTISYNSVSEYTAPTVLESDEKTGPFPKPIRVEPRKYVDRDLMHIEAVQRMQFSENSSNDGSWSDRTLNADNESVYLEEEKKKDVTEADDATIDKLSDSSSFYNVNVSSELKFSESSAFVNVEKKHCDPDSSESSQKENVKERTSPVSSSGKSDLVKIGSDRTSGHTSGDEIETTTSSDIEIIPSPNGDNFRNSPAKFSKTKPEATSPNLVDLVLGKTLATKIRGHNRELSEASVQSTASDDSQSSENDRLMRRLTEMTDILEARESKLMEISRQNADLSERNEILKRQVESLTSKSEGGDINVITEEYTQRMSALEKKFQQAIREKDQIRKQIETIRSETTRRTSSEFENLIKEKDEMISQLQEEGEKLSHQQLQHSNIIKKLRAKEKDNEQVIKGLRDRISEHNSEMERLKRSLAMKEEVEVSQIEAVYRLTNANKKLETELFETKSSLEDLQQIYVTNELSFEAAKHELSELQRASGELARRSEAFAAVERERDIVTSECERLRAQLQQLRSEMMQEERRWSAREESLRREVELARALGADACGSEAANLAREASEALLAQLAALQRAALRKDTEHAAHCDTLLRKLGEKESELAKSQERERLSREEAATLQERAAAAQGLLDDVQGRLQDATARWQTAVDKCASMEDEFKSKITLLENENSALKSQLEELERRVTETETLLERERSALDTERKRNAILQEQLANRGDVSPAHSLASDTLSASLWSQEDIPHLEPTYNSTGVFAVEELMSTAQRHSSANKALHNLATSLAKERDALTSHVARLTEALQDQQQLQQQYDALLLMFGEQEERLAETRLDLHDVTMLYKQQIHELVALRGAAGGDTT